MSDYLQQSDPDWAMNQLLEAQQRIEALEKQVLDLISLMNVAPPEPEMLAGADVMLSIDPVTKIITITPWGGNKVGVLENDFLTTRFLNDPVTYDASGATVDRYIDVYLAYDVVNEIWVASISVWTNDTTRSEAQTVIEGLTVLDSDHSQRFLGIARIPTVGDPSISGDWGDMFAPVGGIPAGNFYVAQDGIGKRTADSGINVALFDDAQDPSGWVDPEAVGDAMTYDKSARTITITGTHEYYWHGIKKSVTDFVSDPHDVANGNYYLYSANGTDFDWDTSRWLFYYAMIAKAKYGASDKYAMVESHGCMPWQCHLVDHFSKGAFRTSGGNFADYVENSANDTNTRWAVDALEMYDEDLPRTIAAGVEDTYTTMRIGSGSVATYDTAATFPFRSSGSYILVNNPLTGAETAGTNNRYVNVYTIFVPVTADADSQKYRILCLQPQAQYTTLAAAQAENPAGLVLGDFRTDAPEAVIYGRCTYILASGDANTGKCRIATGGISYVVGNSISIIGSAPLSAHASTHQHGGSDEVATATPGANAIPKADGSGTLNSWVTVRVKKSFILALDGLAYSNATPPSATLVNSFAGYAFTIGDGGNITFRVPPDCDTNEDIVIKYSWYINEAYGLQSGEIQWGLDYSPVKVGETVEAGYTRVSSGDINIPATAYCLAETSLTIPHAALEAGDVVGLLIVRLPIDAGTNPTAKPTIIMIDVVYTANRFGDAV
jgi:hypothetical protein